VTWTWSKPEGWDDAQQAAATTALKGFVNQVMEQDVLVNDDSKTWTGLVSKDPATVVLSSGKKTTGAESATPFPAETPPWPIPPTSPVPPPTSPAPPSTNTAPQVLASLQWRLSTPQSVIPSGQAVVMASRSHSRSGPSDRELADRAYTQGIELYWQGRYAEAMARFGEAIARVDDDACAWYFKALSGLAMGDTDTATFSATRGAELELRALPDSQTVGQSLVRVQGPSRAFLSSVIERTRKAKQVAVRR
jgi:TolA-binding protein